MSTVIADAAAQVVDPGYEAHLRNRLRVGSWPWKHVADFSHLTFRLLRRGVLFLAKRLAGGIFNVPNIRAKDCLGIRVGEWMDYAVAGIEAEWIEVAL
jgi:hypothetical protein